MQILYVAPYRSDKCTLISTMYAPTLDDKSMIIYGSDDK